MTKLIAVIILGLIILWLISSFISMYNRLVMLKNNVTKSFANIDVLLKQRADEIPNLIKVVKEYMKYEGDVLNKLTELRTSYMESQSINEKISLSGEIDKNMRSIMAVSENYPNLKANDTFLSLHGRVSALEDNIADRREFYNESVNMYNIGIAEFPDFLLAKLLRYKEMSMLHISEEEKKYDGVQF